MSRYRAIYVPLARPSPQFLNRNASAAIEKVPHSIDNLLSIASRSSSEISLGMDRKKERKKGEREREGKFETGRISFLEILRNYRGFEIGRFKYVCADFRARCFATNATKCRAKEWIDINCKQCPIHHVKSIQRIVRSNIESNKRLPQLYQIIADLHIAFGVHVTIIHVIRCHRRPAIFV